MSETVVIISDLHLGQGDDFDIFAGPGKASAFIDFMKFVGAKAGNVELVINGDFVDFLQLKPWDLRVDPATALIKITKIIAAHNDTVFRALGEFLAPAKNRITVLLGNHDVELAFPKVWQQVADAILAAAGGVGGDRLVFQAMDNTRVTYVKPVGGVLVHISHGNLKDPYNGMNYSALLQDAERGTSDFSYPPGTKLVYDIMNRHKADFRFVDLLKPEVPAVPLLLMALKPGAIVDMPGIGIKSLAALGNGLAGWLRKKISGDTLSAVEGEAPAIGYEEQFSKDMAAAYRSAFRDPGAISPADITLLQQFLETDEVDEEPAQPVLGSRLETIKKRLVRAAILSLGRPLDLNDMAYYNADHHEKDDVKWAGEQLVGNVKIVVFGHTHRPLKTEFQGGGLYLNSGAWANQMTLPGPADDISDWISNIRTNSDRNRAAFSTYIVLAPRDAGVTATLNVWEDAERVLWRKDISA